MREFTVEHKNKLRLAKLGDKNPMKVIETRKKQSQTRKLLGLKPPSNKGKKFSKEHRNKLSKALLKEKSHLWKGGISYHPYSLDWTETLRRSIRERDSYCCKMCGKQQGDRAHDVHHIDYNKDNCCPNNLITLCADCHRITGFNREKWIIYFKHRSQAWKQ